MIWPANAGVVLALGLARPADGLAAPELADPRDRAAPAAAVPDSTTPVMHPVSAPAPDASAVAAAEDANLEPTGRSGMMFAAAIGPAVQIGFGIKEQATGTGGGFSLRVGRVATRDTIVLIEACGTVYPYETTTGQTKFNQSTLLAVGAQTYVAPTLWLRGAAGFASFTSRNRDAGGERTRFASGAGVVGGVGVDLVRRKSAALELEVLVDAAAYRDGIIVGGGFVLGLGIN